MCCLHTEDISRLADCPDFQQLGPGSIGVDDIRSMQLQLAPRPYTLRRAVAILNAHHMTEQAQNALLKTLEEPPHDTYLFLSGEEGGLLQTIRSRCVLLRLGAESEDVILAQLALQGFQKESAKIAAAMSGGAPGLAEIMASDEFQAFFAQAADALLQALSALLPPYSAIDQLLKVPLPELAEASERAASPQPARTPTEEKRGNAWHLLNAWLHMLRAMRNSRLHAPSNAALLPEKVRAIAERFTTKQIQGMIELVLSAQARIMVANPHLTLDSLVTSLSMAAK